MRPPTWVRAALSHPWFTGISRQPLGELVAELADPGPPSTRPRCGSAAAMGGGAPPGRAQAAAGLCDRVLVTLVVRWFQLPHQALAVLVGSTAPPSRGPCRRSGRCWPDGGLPSPASTAGGCGCRRSRTCSPTPTPGGGVGRRRLPDQVRRPHAHRPGRRAFVSGKRKQNTIKMTTPSDGQGRTLWSGAVRPGQLDDQTEAGPHPAVVPADLCGACHLRASTVAVAAALARPPRGFRRGLPGGWGAGLRPGRPPLRTVSQTDPANTPQP
jgi:hypothetical protein